MRRPLDYISVWVVAVEQPLIETVVTELGSKALHQPQSCSGNLKEFKRIAMRADKTDHSYLGEIYLAAAVINSR